MWAIRNFFKSQRLFNEKPWSIDNKLSFSVCRSMVSSFIPIYVWVSSPRGSVGLRRSCMVPYLHLNCLNMCRSNLTHFILNLHSFIKCDIMHRLSHKHVHTNTCIYVHMKTSDFLVLINTSLKVYACWSQARLMTGGTVTLVSHIRLCITWTGKLKVSWCKPRLTLFQEK